MATATLAPRLACYHAQQAVEKALKAVLIFAGVGFPLRHDLDQLRNLIPAGWPLKQEHPNLGDLTEWAVEARYPGNWPDATDADARSAAAEARTVWEAVLRDLEDHGFDVKDFR